MFLIKIILDKSISWKKSLELFTFSVLTPIFQIVSLEFQRLVHLSMTHHSDIRTTLKVCVSFVKWEKNNCKREGRKKNLHLLHKFILGKNISGREYTLKIKCWQLSQKHTTWKFFAYSEGCTHLKTTALENYCLYDKETNTKMLISTYLQWKISSNLMSINKRMNLLCISRVEYYTAVKKN